MNTSSAPFSPWYNATMVCDLIKGGLVPVFLLAGIVALMAGQSIPGFIFLGAAFIFHRH